jgi:hypothetical protein
MVGLFLLTAFKCGAGALARERPAEKRILAFTTVLKPLSGVGLS